jgi:hypothetical protein
VEQTKISKFYHAVINTIACSGEVLGVRGKEYSASIDTNVTNFDQIKMFIKMADIFYPKTSRRDYKNVFGRYNDDIFKFFGNPKSIKDITKAEFIRHVEWLEFVCRDNNIKY